jgi:hypothetical protein
MMANRSDRRFLNLQGFKAIKAAGVIRRERADFHHGPEREELHQEAGYMNATGFLSQSETLRTGLGPYMNPLGCGLCTSRGCAGSGRTRCRFR